MISIGIYEITLWLAIFSLILLVSSELLNPYYGRTRIIIERKRLKNVALLLGVLFLFATALRIYEIIITI